MKFSSKDFWVPYLTGTGPSLKLVVAFLLTAGIVSNLFYDILLGSIGPEEIPIPVVASLILTGGAYYLYRRDLLRKYTISVDVDESKLAPPHDGVIVTMAPGSFEHQLFAVRHHAKQGGGKHCWVIMQNIEGANKALGGFTQAISSEGMNTTVHKVEIRRLEASDAYAAVRDVYDRHAVKERLQPNQIIADITGGTKPITAGMVLATMTTGNPLQYVETERDKETGRPIPGTERVVLVDTQFQVTKMEQTQESDPGSHHA